MTVLRLICPGRGRISSSLDAGDPLMEPMLDGVEPMLDAEESREVRDFELSKQNAGVGRASFVTEVLVLSNTILGGAGMLGVPHSFAVAGYAVGAVALCLFGILSAFGCHLLQCAARKVGQAPCTFYTVANAVAPRWTWLIDFTVMIKCFGVSTSYLIIAGGLAPAPIQLLFGVPWMQRSHCIALGFLVAGGLSCFSNLSALRYTATCSVLIVCWTVVLLVLFWARPDEQLEPCGGVAAFEPLPCQGAAFEPAATSDPFRLGKGLPVFIFAFSCHQNVFTVCNEVRQATRKRVDGIIVVSYTIAAFLFGLAGFTGYATYGDQVMPDVLMGYPQEKAMLQVTRLLYSMLVIFSYPFQAHPARNSILALWKVACSCAEVPHEVERWRFWVITAVYMALSLAIALSVTDLGIVLGVVGATGSTLICYVLPGLLYAKAFMDRRSSLEWRLAVTQMVLGCVIMPTCLYFLFA